MTNWAGCAIPIGVEVLLAATLWRSATSSINAWPQLLELHHLAALHQLPLVRVVQGLWTAPCWASATSIAQHLRAA
eukprot:5897744-Pyramimonas_sp.AAC.1